MSAELSVLPSAMPAGRLSVAHNLCIELERESAALRAKVICGFYEDGIPVFRQGHPEHELEDVVTAKEVAGYVKLIGELRIEKALYRADEKRIRALVQPEEHEELFEAVERKLSELRAEIARMRPIVNEYRNAPHHSWCDGWTHSAGDWCTCKPALKDYEAKEKP